MTKDQYFEMCDAMGSDPVESEIPVELSDFPFEIQEVFNIYYLLTDVWDGMSGTYQGKNTSIVFSLFELYKIDKEDQLVYLMYIRGIDNVRKRLINEKVKKQAEKPSA
jgi:hypothetical protein